MATRAIRLYIVQSFPSIVDQVRLQFNAISAVDNPTVPLKAPDYEDSGDGYVVLVASHQYIDLISLYKVPKFDGSTEPMLLTQHSLKNRVRLAYNERSEQAAVSFQRVLVCRIGLAPPVLSSLFA